MLFRSMMLNKLIQICSSFLPGMTNIFGMISRNSEMFKQDRRFLYSKMIQAFQKIFFYSRQFQFKILALNLASIMILWVLEEYKKKTMTAIDMQIVNIIATSLFKETYQCHYILHSDNSTDKDATELTYKALYMLKLIFNEFQDFQFKIPLAEKHANTTPISPNRVFMNLLFRK